MTQEDTGLNLLFGVIALQLDLIDAHRFAEACSAWAATKDGSLGGVLQDRGWISAADRSEIERVLRRKLDRFGGDARRGLGDAMDHSLATLVSSIAGGGDPDLGFATGVGASQPGGPAADGVPTAEAPATDGARGVGDRYRLVRLFARGGLGQVWLARDPVLGRDVALKELRPERAADPTSRARFLREARISGRLDHPGIVTVHELAGRAGDQRAFYAMQLVRGRTLRDAVRDYHGRRGACGGGTLELHTLLDDFVAVCNAVAYAHSRGVIHRDLKGQNIVLGDFGEVVVLDWGLAKVVGQAGVPTAPDSSPRGAPEDGEEGLTLEGQRMGTPGFMAPEQAEGRHELVGIASDIYGLGAILYEILTGAPPFADSGLTEALRRVSVEDPAPPRRVCPDIPGALEAICLKALSKRPEDRYAAAPDLAQDVRRWLADEPVSAYREPASEKLGRWGRRHRPAMAERGRAPRLATVFAGLIVVALAVGREQVKSGEAVASGARHRRRAEANFAAALDAAEVHAKILESPQLVGPGTGPLRLAIIRAAQDLYARLDGLAPEEPHLKVRLAQSYLDLSRIRPRGRRTSAVRRPRHAGPWRSTGPWRPPSRRTTGIAAASRTASASWRSDGRTPAGHPFVKPIPPRPGAPGRRLPSRARVLMDG